ncbi:putative RNA methyltransferase [Neptuniibacter caesariensis]|uniref:rRNA (Guanine-N1-)-methyltransferase, putative n=1 Tax=Neptuniibacter caesariensis TaxID=207954 RepID=A0A7U8C462_NEPCE|nr:methyltransferase domain-containing protein [Neptuniibacter caesariensis]EAR59780.1 RRNA (guanine-N1-)-methyltransferase, putative [Oceanospirillum sp. MED92] [Neptuniibacter caesariensis]
MQLSCPVCEAPLVQNDKNLRCEANHSFDAARQGYWNLLLAHKKRSKDPGDNPEMVQARRRFLNNGFYKPLSDKVNQLCAELLSSKPEPCILDMGCGEGYYTDRLQQHLTAHGSSPLITGLDISKHAVKAACSRSKQITWLVASGAATPVPQNSLDLQLVLFSRLMPEALAKPLKSEGYLLVAWPGAKHLLELREAIYESVRESHFDPAATLKDYFSLERTESVNFQFQLNGEEEIDSLLAMTPHGQRLKEEARQRLLNLETLDLTADVNLGIFHRI